MKDDDMCPGGQQIEYAFFQACGRSVMELLLERSQRSAMLGAVKFSVKATARLTSEEQELVRKYKLADVLLYEKGADKMAAATGTMSFLAARFMQMRVTVTDLMQGKTFEGKDLAEVLAAQDQIKEAVGNLRDLLVASKNFDGEEVLSY
jgi:hypothetical protein